MAFYSFFPGLVRLDKKKPKDQVENAVLSCSMNNFDKLGKIFSQIKAKVITIHPDHTAKKETSDICVIELKTKMKISETIKPICLPAKGMGFATEKLLFCTFLKKKLPEPELDLGLNEVFSAGWGANAVQV